MTQLQQIELRVLQMLPTLNLRSTLTTSAEFGRLLTEAKNEVPRGEWQSWLKRVGVAGRTARTHMQIYAFADDRPTTATMTIEQFLAYHRQSRIAAGRAEREVRRADAAARMGTLPDALQLHHADCREHKWPQRIDAIVTDPPWADMAAYEWLAEFAVERLHDGGVMLLNCGTHYLHQVLNIMVGAGLRYNWTLAVVYASIRDAKPTGTRYLAAWKPILLFSKGELTKGDYLGDVFTVKSNGEGNGTDEKHLHKWGQPTEPMVYWMGRLISPGSLVVDPFAGSGTSGVVARQLGMRWIGTEMDQITYEIARGRLLATKKPPVTL